MKLLHFEDDKNQSLIFHRLLTRAIPGIQYQLEEEPYCASPIVTIENPDALICDYYFKDNANLEMGLIDAIKRFDGYVAILSAEHPATIRSILESHGVSLDKVKVFRKDNVSALIEDIMLNCGEMCAG